MPKLHDKIYYAIIWRQNRLAMKWVDQNRATIEQGLYRGAIQLLHHAVKYRNYRFARALLKRGVDIDCLDGFRHTALQDAAQRGHLGGMKWLILHGADFAGQKVELLLAAIRWGQPKIVKWLLKKGFDANAVGGPDGQNALRESYECCDEKEREKIAALLRQFGIQFPPDFDPSASDENCLVEHESSDGEGSSTMAESASPSVFMFDNSDPDMQRAYEQARATFRYFWREIAWERRRIVPALDLACVKIPFTDSDPRGQASDTPEVEHMWVSDVDFDGEFVSGVLLNEPNWLKSVKQGDSARVPVGQISDWMYAISGEVYGAYTVNLLRSRMSLRERREHDAVWGLNFGDPASIRGVSEQEHHAMSKNMASSLQDHLAQNPAAVSAKGHNGWTLLHQAASAGSTAIVKVLLAAGADPNARADNGMTPLQLARVLGWDSVAELLARG